MAKRKKTSDGKMKISTVNNCVKFDIDVGYISAGVSAESHKPSKQGGRVITVIQSEFISSEDGDILVSRLEELISKLLNKITEQHNVIVVKSSIDNMVVILRRDGTATIHINAPVMGGMLLKKAVNAGQAIYQRDIADISQLTFEDIDISKDAGVMVLFSVGWRKGLFYDLVPLSKKDLERDYDINQLLGGYYAYLSFQEKFNISDSEWDSLFENGWFPFITLNYDLIRSVLSHNKESWNVDDLLPNIQADVLKRLPDGLKSWAKVKAFEPHMDFISKAVGHYQNSDPISCISVLFPRIEGIMREFQIIQGQPEKAGQKDLAATVQLSDTNPKRHQFSLLLPLRFQRYLEDVYFDSFDPARKDNTLSRNSVGHGVASADNFDMKGATLGFLVLDQLSYYFRGIS